MIRGVNLGGWLVLEPWMTPDLFPEVAGYDETRLSLELSPRELEFRLEAHRRSWIGRDDFLAIADSGLNLVRLPYPWWVFGDEDPYVGSIEYVDQAFEWAQEAGLDLMLDLHTAPGCQNGFDNGGILGVIDWPKDPANLEKTIDVLVRVAERYTGRNALHSFGVLNEPGYSVDLDLIKRFYVDAEHALRPILGDIPLVFHDAFRAGAWDGFFREHGFGPYLFDMHLYQCFSDEDTRSDMDGHVGKSLGWRREELARRQAEHPTIVGEWSLGLPAAAVEALDAGGRRAALTRYAEAQLEGMAECSGWIFWSWKVADPDSGWNLSGLLRSGVVTAAALSRDVYVSDIRRS